MDIPFFSVLIPVYKNIDYLDVCLKSIINQDFINLEIVICYQGDTIQYSAIKDTRIKNIYLEKPSSYLARIELYKKAIGKYVLFVDSDDELFDGTLSYLHGILQQNNDVDIIQFGYTISKHNILDAKEQKVLYQEEYRSYFLSQLGTYPIWRKCFKRNDVQFYNEDIFMGDDALLTLAFINESKKIINTDKVLYYYRPNAKSGTSNLKVKYLDDLAIFLNHSYQYRKDKREIEMEIYSFVSTFLVFHNIFPRYNFLSLKNVKKTVDRIASYNYITNPIFVKRYFIKITHSNICSVSDKIYRLFLKVMKFTRKNFNVTLEDC